MTTRRWLIVAGALALAAVAGVTFLITRPDDDGDDVWEQVEETGALRVGMDASYPPFEFVNEQNEIVGFDVDLANEIGQQLGLEMVFVNMAYDTMFDALLVGQVDVLITALVAAPELEGKAYFSVPYFNAGERLVVPVGSPVVEMADLEGRTVAVEYGSGGDVEARRWERRLSRLTIVREADPDAALAAVVEGRADAALVDGISARLGVGQHDSLALADYLTESLFAVAVHPDSPTLLARMNEALTELIHDGTVDDLTEKWFGPQREQQPLMRVAPAPHFG
jgi:ABC-type amino acid transport substrate-binding protein